MKLHVVWFKRDLRLADHLPLQLACRDARRSGGALVLVYLLEPSLLAQKDSAAQHLEFSLECLQSLAEGLPALCPLHVVESEACAFFESCFEQGGVLYSHQETGNWASFDRDKALASVLRARGVIWNQIQSNAVVRGPLNRDEWTARWIEATSGEPLAPPDLSVLSHSAQVFALTRMDSLAQHLSPGETTRMWQWSKGSLERPHWCKPLRYNMPDPIDKPERQKGGVGQALYWLREFLHQRGQHYRKEMSSPLGGESSCSRVSPYLTFGVLSIRQVLQELQRARDSLAHRVKGLEHSAQIQREWAASYKSFESRLHWHCHFIQKLESEPELEFRCAHRAFEGMRNAGTLSEEEQQKLKAWASGHTGFPMIDACMRMLHACGWINFRMRAMLVAFASYQLWLDWRHTAPVLARLFLDYEPGIHYPQFQMQSGVTGINTLRIYNPVKQAQDQDPDGVFLRHWLPELRHLPVEYLSQPWLLPPMLAHSIGFELGRDYPEPVVDPVTAIGQARSRMTAFRRHPQFEAESQRVYLKHGSRKRHPADLKAMKGASTAKTGNHRQGKRVAKPAQIQAVNPSQLGLFDEGSPNEPE